MSDETRPGFTLVALPFVSKIGFSGMTVASIVTGIAAGGFKNARFIFLCDHTQVGARNHACREAIRLGAEWLWFIDSDMDFPNHTLQSLKNCDADVACTDMWSRNIPSFRTVAQLSEPDSNGQDHLLPAEGKGVIDIDSCGMACTLIRVSLLRKMEDPWFFAGRHGEDASFCLTAKKVYGAKMRCDMSITAGHWGVMRMVGQPFTRDVANQPMSLSDPDMMGRMKVFQGGKEVTNPEGGV